MISNVVTKNKGYGEHFTTYKKSKYRKYKVIINILYNEVKVNHLMKLRLSIDGIEASGL